MPTGYKHPDYANSLSEFGLPRELPLCGGWILERQVPGVPYRDAMGCYPLFVCQDWRQLCHDLDHLGRELVSLAIVTDPFGDYDVSLLRKSFDVVTPFKEHFVVDLEQELREIVSKSHRDTVQRAIKKVDVKLCPNPSILLDEWVSLYSNLIQRHDITGIRAFSRDSFRKQLAVPGMVVFQAESEGEIIGLDLWYVQGSIAYGHLVACNSLGYKLRASYALKWYLIQYFADKVRWLDLGAGAGLGSEGSLGLSQFKQGWSTGTRTAYFCGRVFDHEKYSEILKSKGIKQTNYFPAYREGEFG